MEREAFMAIQLNSNIDQKSFRIDAWNHRGARWLEGSISNRLGPVMKPDSEIRIESLDRASELRIQNRSPGPDLQTPN